MSELYLDDCKGEHISICFLTEEYKELCPHDNGYAPVGPDVFEDINECKLYPGICGEGLCINMDGTFRCECHAGFILDQEQNVCVGE